MCVRKLWKGNIPCIFPPERAMLVARDHHHANTLASMLLDSGNGLIAKDIHVGALQLTERKVRESGGDKRVVIVPLRQCEGYSLTRMGVQVSSVYPSNQSTREQIEGRINRMGQRRQSVRYRMVHTGVLSAMWKKQIRAANLSAALRSLASEMASVTE